MPFHREWDRASGSYTINRDRTGPAPPPETGTTAKEDGTVIVANQNVTPSIPPSTPVPVNFPGPNEPIVGANGMITPRWWRFLDELYRRTGGVQDNINKIHTTYLFPTTSSMVLSGQSVTIDRTIFIYEFPSTASVAMTGQATYPYTSSPVRSPDTVSVALTGQAVDITNTS